MYNLFRVGLFHSDETFHAYACTRSVSFSNKTYKKPVTFFLNGCKKLLETHYSLEKKCMQVPKMVTPPDKKIMVHP